MQPLINDLFLILSRVAKATLSAHAAGDYEGAFKAVMDMDLASQSVLQSLDALASALSDELADADKRREARQKVEGVADLHGGDATRLVRIVNRSTGGLGAEGIQKVDVGRTLGVVIDGAERLGEAVWAKRSGRTARAAASAF